MTELEDRLSAGAVAGRSEIEDVRLLKAQVEAPEFADPDKPLQFQFTSTPSAHYEDGADAFVISVEYELSVSQDGSSDAEDADEVIVASINFTFAALYSKPIEDSFADEALEAFAKTTGSFAVYPYAREYVQDVTGRLGLPPLTLGLFKIDPESPEE